MTTDEITGRLCVLEVLSMTALGMYLANSRNDPDYSKAEAFLEHIRSSISSQSTALQPSSRLAAEAYADEMMARLTESIRTLRGEGGRAH